MITYPMILGTVGRKFESCRPDHFKRCLKCIFADYSAVAVVDGLLREV